MRTPVAADPRIDDDGECIWRGDERIALTPKAFAVLRRLRQQPNQLVTKQELLDAAWPDTHVIDVVLNNAIAQLRQALGDDRKRARFIETVHRRGFRWIGPPPGAPPAPIAPFDPDGQHCAGRAGVLDDLQTCYARAAAGRRQVVFVTGEPGIGKTSVVTHFLTGTASATGGTAPLIAYGQCVEQFGAGEPYRPLLEAVETLLRNGTGEMRAIFTRHAPTWLLQMPELLSAAAREKLLKTLTASTNERMQREFVGAIGALSRDRPLVLVLEDLHWSDHATVALLWALAAQREPARLLVIGTYRPVDAIADHHPVVRLTHELVSKRQCVELALAGLDLAAVEAVVDRRFARRQLPRGFSAQLHAQTSGNPLFLLNALADFEQRGWLSGADGTWRCSVGLDTLAAAVPDGSRALIAFRLEQLPAATLEMLEAASLLGISFSTQAVAAAIERSCEEVEAECSRLARAVLFLSEGNDLSWPDGTRGRQHTFHHALYQQVLATRLAPTRRQLLHRRIAARLEAGYGERARDVAGQLSLHYEQGGEVPRAVDWIEESARQAYARCASHEAEVLLGHAVALLQGVAPSPGTQERLLKLTIAYGLALGASRGSTSEAAGRAFEAARALGQAMPTSAEHLTSLASLAVGRLMRARLHDAHGLGAELLALVGDEGPPHAVISAHLASGTALVYLGELDAGLRALHRAAAVAQATPELSDGSAPLLYDPLVPLEATLGMALVLAGETRPGWAMVEACVARARRIDMPWYLGFALAAASSTAIMRADRGAARRYTTELLAHCEASQLPLWLEMARVMHAWLVVHEHGDSGLLEPLRVAVDEFRRVGRLASPRMLSLLADAYVAVGRCEDALGALDEAFDVRGEERFYDVELLRQRAAALLAHAGQDRARRDQAADCLEQAIAIATAQGSRLFGLRATADLCRLWLDDGRVAAARRRLTATLKGFSPAADDADLLAARTLLDTGRSPAARR
ncbi:MAG: AAA family ATPase [Deltaproteobacteria bacterium]|nr:AAA family ATPase [Deltaproteobacteria bacterium]